MRKPLTMALSALLLASALPAAAVRAIRDLIPVTQPDGSTLNIRLVGDERAHFTLSEDNALLTEEDGAYFFGIVADDGQVISTGVPAANPELRSEMQKKYADISIRQNLLSAAEIRWQRNPRFYDKPVLRKRSAAISTEGESSLPQFGLGRCVSSFPNKGEVKALVLLVEYQDVKFSIDKPEEYFHNLLNKDGFDEYNATGCAAEYFRFNSNNQFIPTFDVVGPVTLSKNRSYYGENRAMEYDVNAGMMVVEGLKALDDEIDFSKYDMDKDGVLDNVFVFYAGRGEATGGGSSSVWPHSSNLEAYKLDFIIDGVKVDTYGCTNEQTRSGDPDGVGTFIHEFSHVIGLPDLYDTYNSLSCTPDYWSVLDYGPYNNGGHTPPNYSAFELNAMKWIEPELIDGPEEVVLEDLAESRQFRIVQTDRENEFFLLENRQNTGWDKYLPGHGMLIWHIDWNENIFEQNIVNTRSSHQYVHLKKANNIHSSSRGNTEILAGWSWPGKTGATEFTAETAPAFQSWSGKNIDLPLTEIREENGVIYFKVSGGLGIFGVPVALDPDQDEIGNDWFIAKWNPIDVASDYLLTVQTADKGGASFEVVADMGDGYNFSLPFGWTSSSETVNVANGNYGNSKPSYKMDEDKAWLLTEKTKSDINEISFWYKVTQVSDSHLDVIGIREDGSEVSILKASPGTNKGVELIINDVPQGVRQVKFVWNKVEANLSLDDVRIARRGAPSEIVEGYDHISTSGATSFKVQNLDNSKDYDFFIEATDGSEISHPSNVVRVRLSSSNGTVEIVDNNIVTVNGRTITSCEPVTIFDISGTVIANGVTTYDFASPGLYLVRTEKSTRKIMIR